MGRCAVIVVVLGACSFRSTAAPDAASVIVDAPVVHDTPDDVAIDGPTAGLCGGKIWEADFSTDPTTQDLNHDNVDDFVIRDGSPFPGVLAGGVWTLAAEAEPLDTRPLQNFTTRVIARVRMRSTSPPTTHGAIMWLNVNYNGTTFTPVFVDAAMKVASATGVITQTATLYTKASDGSEVAGASVADLDTGMHDYSLDIDSAAATAHYIVDGVDLGTQTLTPDPLGGNDDRFATVQANGGAAEFDEFRLEVCP